MKKTKRTKRTVLIACIIAAAIIVATAVCILYFYSRKNSKTEVPSRYFVDIVVRNESSHPLSRVLFGSTLETVDDTPEEEREFIDEKASDPDIVDMNGKTETHFMISYSEDVVYYIEVEFNDSCAPCKKYFTVKRLVDISQGYNVLLKVMDKENCAEIVY